MKKDIRHYIGSTSSYELPPELKPAFKKAKVLEWITLGYLATVILLMYLVMGSSQAMKAAWIEDVLSIFPAIAFLVASKFYTKNPDDDFPYGYHKIFTLAFAAASLTLLFLGLYLLIDSVTGLVEGDHPTIGTFKLFDKEIWMGWVMIGVLFYSFLPAVILGNKKLPFAKKLHVKVLFVDSQAQKADWMTALAGIAGVIGIGFGLWWSDAVAAIFISLSIVHDGFMRTKDGMKDLMEETPYTYDNSKKHPLLRKVIDVSLQKKWVKDVRIRFREHGMVFFGDVYLIPASEQDILKNIEELHKEIKDLSWQIEDVMIFPVRQFPNPNE